MRSEPGTLRLLTTPRWQTADAGRSDVSDSLPGYLLLYLAYRGNWITREGLAAVFWPERPQDEALRNLRANLHRVRALLSAWGRAGALRAEHRRVRVDLPTDVAELRSALARGDWIAAADLAGDELLSTLSFRGFAHIDAWASEERRSLAALWRDAGHKAAQDYTRRGDTARAAEVLLRLARHEVLTEPVMQDLLRLAEPAGRQAEALAVFEQFRAWLGSELQLQPSAVSVALAAALRERGNADVSSQAQIAGDAEAAQLLLFGAVELRSAPGHAFVAERRYQLLIVLAVRAGEWVARDYIASLLWPELPAADARRNLRHTLFKAREVPGAANVEASDHALRWSITTDAQAFATALQRKRLTEAVALRRGPPATGVDDPVNRSFSEWLGVERARLDALWHQAALEHLRTLADPAQRGAQARRLLLADPLDEEAMACLLEAELELGHRAGAQRIYRDYAARLADELGIEPPQHMRDLLAGASSLQAGDRPADSAAFVGRRIELAQLNRMLGQADCRQVTLFGPGGVGKSTLARHALAIVAPTFRGGTAWVELQDLDTVAAVLARLAAHLSLAINDAQDPVEQIAAQLRRGRVLAVLDNAEHLPELAATVDRLLEAAPQLTVLLTSRARVPGRCEQLLPLEGLAVPDEESRDLEAAASFDAVRLFELRATAAQRTFRLAADLPAVIEIVTAVGGLPLAIELAAAWTRLLPANEIARDLHGALDVLERDPAAAGDAVRRPDHVSVRAVLDRSWQLLAPREREAMISLSVFHGGFDRSAAQAVADVPLPLLSALVDKSFLTVDEKGRFGLHPLVATYAARDAMHGEAQLLGRRQRHAEFFARFIDDLTPHTRGDHQPLVRALDTEFSNVMAAWRFAAERHLPALVGAMATALGTYFEVRGRPTEGAAELRRALDLAPDEPETQRALARVRAALAGLLHRKRDLDLALSVALAGIEIAERCSDRRSLAGCLSHAGSCHSVRGRWDLARPYFERALAIAREDNDRPALAASLLNIGVCAKKDGNLDEALALYTQSLALERELQHYVAIGRCLNNMGVLHMERRDWAKAREIMAQGLRHCEQFGLAGLAPYLENGLGLACFELGSLDEAERHLRRAHQRAVEAEVQVVELNASAFLARVECKRGHFSQAHERFRAVAKAARRSDSLADMLDVAMYYAELLRDTGRRIEAVRAWRMVIAHPMAEAGVRASCTQALQDMAATETEQADGARKALDLIEFIDALIASAGA